MEAHNSPFLSPSLPTSAFCDTVCKKLFFGQTPSSFGATSGLTDCGKPDDHALYHYLSNSRGVDSCKQAYAIARQRLTEFKYTAGKTPLFGEDNSADKAEVSTLAGLEVAATLEIVRQTRLEQLLDTGMSEEYLREYVG